MNKEEILQEIKRFCDDVPAEDMVLKSFMVDISRNSSSEDPGMIILFLITCLGYCHSGRTIDGVDFTQLYAKTLLESHNVEKIKGILKTHTIGTDYKDSAAEMTNAFGNKIMSASFSEWGDIARNTAHKAFEIGYEMDDSEESEEEVSLNSELDDDLRSILGGMFDEE